MKAKCDVLSFFKSLFFIFYRFICRFYRVSLVIVEWFVCTNSSVLLNWLFLTAAAASGDVVVACNCHITVTILPLRTLDGFLDSVVYACKYAYRSGGGGISSNDARESLVNILLLLHTPARINLYCTSASTLPTMLLFTSSTAVAVSVIIIIFYFRVHTHKRVIFSRSYISVQTAARWGAGKT